MRCVDATEVPYPAHHRRAPLKGWALKAFALHATKWVTERLRHRAPPVARCGLT